MAKKINSETTAPSGFATVCKSEFPPKFDFDKQPELTGGVIMMKTAKVQRDGEMKDVRIMIIGIDGDEFSIWESAGLTDLFNSAKAGDAAWIKYVGEIELKGKPQPMRGFEGAIKKGAGHEYNQAKAETTS